MKLTANIDGASFGNPGKSGIGVVIRDHAGKVLVEHHEHLGEGTNNRAEYFALLRCIEMAEKFEADELEIRSDSQLVVSQMNGLYKIKNRDIKTLAIKIREKIRNSRLKIRLTHIPRELNKDADKLAKKGAGLDVQE